MHSHAHGFTAEQVHSGLYALLVVHDADDDALSGTLLTGPGNDLAMALSDARVSTGVLLPYAPIAGECLHGWYGNQMLVNGALDAAFVVSSGWVRLRLLNACNARGLLLAFLPASSPDAVPRPFHLLGTDGGLLATPRRIDRLFFHAAERVDIAIPMRPNESLKALSLAFDPRHQIRSNGNGHGHPARDRYPPLSAAAMCAIGDVPAPQRADGAVLPLFSLNSGTAVAPEVASMPEKLSSLNDATDSGEPPTRRLRLDFDEQRGFLIDNQSYRLDEAGIGITRGSREIWEIRNSPISMPHPMHLHGFQFRVLRRQGTFGPARSLATESNGRLQTDLGLKDTVTIWPNETLRIEIDFSLPQADSFSGSQRYMFHCHNLEHEDGMMMRNVVVT
jgi:suppressor of ftsI/bilirubin oxidase